MRRSVKTGCDEESLDLIAAFVRVFDRMHDEVMMSSPRPALPLHISPPEGRSLVWMGSQNLCTMSEFASGMRVPLSTATHLVDRLVEKGLFVRERSETDRRAVKIRLSGMGKRVHMRFYEQRLAGGRRLLSQLNSQEQAQLLELLEKTVMTSV